jgi:hypothetical protein
MPSLTYREYKERRVSERAAAGETPTDEEREAYERVKGNGAVLKRALAQAGYTGERLQQIQKGYDAWERLPTRERRRWEDVPPELFLRYYRSQSPRRSAPRGTRPRVRRPRVSRARSPGRLADADPEPSDIALGARR